MDLEGGERRRVVISSWFNERVDTTESNGSDIPQHMRLNQRPSYTRTNECCLNKLLGSLQKLVISGSRHCVTKS